IGEVESGTLTTILKKGERSSKTERTRRGNCSRVNIGEMLAKGIPEQEIFAEWLQRLCLSEYLALFLSQGYDLPTLARATPEDLTTLGITKPDDRKCLVQDIQCWQNVAIECPIIYKTYQLYFYLKDNWPTDITKEAPTRDWLTAIGLKQYIQQFERQGCLTVGELEQLEAEDLEDMGVQKLGHAKRIWLALRKLRVGNFLI
uniref:SAM domain-containing protein n=1 Tax=Meloidogyne javanica TaxID=6303 RepID=A0A915MIF1_MELJA